MGYLLDTHVLLWWLIGDASLSASTRRLLEMDEVTLLLSDASLWEMSIKQQKGKLIIPSNILSIIVRRGITILPIDSQSTLQAPRLTFPHSDPFDKMIFYQAYHHKLTLITADRFLLKKNEYNVKTINAAK